MEIQGKIVVVLPEMSGTSKSGNAWKKRDYVLETQEKYPKKVCFQLFNDKIDQYPMQMGQEVKVSVEIESREYNSRWYTQVTAYRVEIIDRPNDASENIVSEGPIIQQQSFDNHDDGLPF